MRRSGIFVAGDLGIWMESRKGIGVRATFDSDWLCAFAHLSSYHQYRVSLINLYTAANRHPHST